MCTQPPPVDQCSCQDNNYDCSCDKDDDCMERHATTTATAAARQAPMTTTTTAASDANASLYCGDNAGDCHQY